MIRIYLSTLLGARKMNQSELSRQTGIRLNTINEMYHELIERINVDHLDKICEALGCRLDELIEYIPNKKIR
jgi:putative transcriptional regulator